MRKKRQYSGFFYILPMLLLTLAFWVIPIVLSGYLSFTKYNGLTAPQWVGLQNYADIFKDETFLASIRNTLLFVLGVVPGQTVLAFVVAAWISQKGKSPAANFVRWSMFVPTLASTSVIGIVCRMLLNNPKSPLAAFFGLFGVSTSQLVGSPTSVLPTLIVIDILISAGYYMVVYLAALTGLAEEQIEQAARLLACEKPGVIWAGNALDHNTDGYQKGCAIAALMAVCGNLDVPGGALMPPPPSPKNGFATRALALGERFGPALKARRLGQKPGEHPAFPVVSGQAVVASLLAGGPLKAAYVAGGNPAVMWADPTATGEALKKLEFLVVADYFLTPTARLADLVLPVASYLETESVAIPPEDSPVYSPRLAGPPEVKSDMEILNSLANAMGYGAEFWPDMDVFWDDFLAPYGLDFARLKTQGSPPAGQAPPQPAVQQFRQKGFPTPDGKLHLALPLEGLSPFEETAASRPEEGLPHLCTCYKPASFFHSAGRQVPAQRGRQPLPVALLGEELAAKLGLQNGDWVRVHTREGWAEQTVQLEPGMAQNVIALASGWWYPEAEGEKSLHADVNRLFSRTAGQGREVPAFSCRGLPCFIEKTPPEHGKEKTQ